jgi:hypothetical protein
MKPSHVALFILGFILLTLIATNPSSEDHKRAVKDKYKEIIKKNSEEKSENIWKIAGEEIVINFGEMVIDKAVIRKNYIIFSISSISFEGISENIGFGILGMIFVGDFDKIKKIARHEDITSQREQNGYKYVRAQFIEYLEGDYSHWIFKGMDSVEYNFWNLESLEKETNLQKGRLYDIYYYTPKVYIPENNKEMDFPTIKKIALVATVNSSSNQTGNNIISDVGNGVAKFKGASFEILFPYRFTVKPSLKSAALSGYESAFFISPESDIEFYIFSAQFERRPKDIEFNQDKERVISDITQKNKSQTLRYYTYESRDKSYIRSYQETLGSDGSVLWVIGLKYKNTQTYNRYKPEYLDFKKSFQQVAY